jgi:hypothetical protein
VTDINGNVQTATQLVTVTNASPVISSVVASSTSVLIGSAILLTVTYTDDNVRTATVDWGDGSIPEIFNSPANVFEATHAYLATGSYPLSVTVQDLCGASTSKAYGSIVVFDRGAGAVNGGGWFESPPGADMRNDKAEGKVNFAFNAKYNLYSDVPVGDASFSLKSADIKFKSTQFELLLISGQTASLKGVGELNGQPGYGVLVTMVDDDSKMPVAKGDKKPAVKSDRVRFKLWDPTGVVIYDTQAGANDDAIASTNIGAGSIEIESGTALATTSTFESTSEQTFASAFGSESTSVYPNPFVDFITVQYNSASSADVIFKLMDLAGRIIASGVYPVSADGSYMLDVPENISEGSYILTIKQGQSVELMNLVKK